MQIGCFFFTDQNPALKVLLSQRAESNATLAEVALSYLERLFIKEIAEENRTRGISLASDICKNYRREGMYFDEILDEAKSGGKQ